MITWVCPLCNSGNIVMIHNKVRISKDTYDYNRQIYKCDDCHIVFQYPLNFGDFYKEEYRNNWNYSTNIREYYNNSLGVALDRLNLINRFLYLENKSLLDVGCSAGSFLDLVKKSATKKVVGIEPNDSYREFANTDLKLSVFQDIKDIKRKFDVVCCFWVLEHVLFPEEFLNSLKSYLKPNGVLFLEVPNVNEALLSFYNVPEFKNYQYQLPHNWYFDEETIKKLLYKCGFNYCDIVKVQRYGLANHLGWLAERKPLGNENRYRELITDSMDDDYKTMLCYKNMNDNLFVMVRRLGDV